MKIPHKIFGVAILVFALMGSSILYSTFKLYQVSKEVTDLAEIFIPLSDQIAEIDLQIVQQELHVERLEKLLTTVRLIDEELREIDAGLVPEHLTSGAEPMAVKRKRLEAARTALREKISREEEEFETREANVDAAIDNAEVIVGQAIAISATVEGQNTLKTLLPVLQSVNQQHSNLYAQMTLLITAFRQDSPMLFELEELIEKEEDQLAQNMKATWERIAHFTERAAR